MSNDLILEKAIADMRFAARELDYCIFHFEHGSTPTMWGDQANARDRLLQCAENLDKIKRCRMTRILNATAEALVGFLLGASPFLIAPALRLMVWIVS